MKDKISIFLDATGFEKYAGIMIDNLVGQFRNGFKEGFGEDLPAEPSEALSLVSTTLKEKRAELRNRVIEVYAKHFSEEEIDGLIAFYQGPIGHRLATIGETVQSEVGQASNEWGNEMIKTIEPELAKILS